MNVVLQFPLNRVVPRGPDDVVLSAEVVIFPGVRRERRKFKLAKPPHPAGNAAFRRPQSTRTWPSTT